jgi:type IV pilus assembly protein PilW
MKSNPKNVKQSKRMIAGVTLVEMMVALAIGSFLIIGAVQVYNQSRHAFVINESIASVQETAQFAVDTMEADLRMASNWGRNSRGDTMEGRSLPDDPNPLDLPAPADCGVDWALDLTRPVSGDNNAYGLICASTGVAQNQSDTLTVRRTTVAAAPLEVGRLQVQSTRVQGRIFADGTVPGEFDPAQSETHNLIVSSYYVAESSDLIPGVPTLRRKVLDVTGGAPTVTDQEVAPGVENLQVQFGVDIDRDNTVDRYVNPNDEIIDPASPLYISTARIITARLWLVVRSISIETGIQDARNYAPGDVNLGVQNDSFRRMQVSKTVLFRNART